MLFPLDLLSDFGEKFVYVRIFFCGEPTSAIVCVEPKPGKAMIAVVHSAAAKYLRNNQNLHQQARKHAMIECFEDNTQAQT